MVRTNFRVTKLPDPEFGITKNKIIEVLTKSPHGKLEEYVPVGLQAARDEPQFFAHLIAWDKINGQIRDAKAALPVISLSEPSFPQDFIENSVAHLLMLNPRELLKAYEFSRTLKIPGRGRYLRNMIGQYLHHTEKYKRWENFALQHRSALKRLYTLTHTKPGEKADQAIVKSGQPKGTIFEQVAQLKNMSPLEAAGVIIERRLPNHVIPVALGTKMKDPDIVMAMIKRMTAAQLINSTKMLERMGIKNNPMLQAAYEEGLKKAAESDKPVATFKASKAIDAVVDKTLKAKLSNLQERQIKRQAGIDGNWLICADRSYSMMPAIEMARHIAGTLAKMVRGKVALVFFNTTPEFYDVTDMTYEQIKEKTKYIFGSGNTSVGCALAAAWAKGFEPDGIALVTDGGENTPPFFLNVYADLSKKLEKTVPLYFYHISGDTNLLSPQLRLAGVDAQELDMLGIDYYGLPDLVKTMRVNKYSLADEIMETPLLTVNDVFQEMLKEN